jgi:Fe-S cluster biogenesis protein NfuA
MFIQTEATPNPASLKFLPGRTVLPDGTLELKNSEDAERSPLAGRLFAIEGVSGVFFGRDFVTVTKSAGEWQHLKPAILGALMEHFLREEPILRDAAASADDDAGEEFYDAADEPVVGTIKELIETRVRPAVANDGGDITFRGFREGVVYLDMKGSCSGCPSSVLTLKRGIENLLKHFVPEVEEVRATEELEAL